MKDILAPKRQGLMGAVNVVNYLSNHDHDRLMVKLGEREIFVDGSELTLDLPEYEAKVLVWGDVG